MKTKFLLLMLLLSSIVFAQSTDATKEKQRKEGISLFEKLYDKGGGYVSAEEIKLMYNAVYNLVKEYGDEAISYKSQLRTRNKQLDSISRHISETNKQVNDINQSVDETAEACEELANKYVQLKANCQILTDNYEELKKNYMQAIHDLHEERKKKWGIPSLFSFL